ncbi:MAG TPA: pyruvate dehydrogenase complex E1 component subunit beta [Acidimicrobiia bacterium]|nr:pyruvate dehydrogenase complex E1 component subunit beta [Acidimicrobiia bacterium]
MAIVKYWRAINDAMAEEMRRDDDVVLFGEDVGEWGGAFGITRGLHGEFGSERVLDTPVSETAIAGAAVGAALGGLRPIAEIQFADFALIAGDEIFNKAAKWRYMHGSQHRLPLVIRLPNGSSAGAGPEHSQCPEVMAFHFPGTKVVLPATARDAKGLLKAAIRSDDPVLYFEHKQLYRTADEIPDPDEVIPIGVARTARRGTDATVVAAGLMVHHALAAAAALAEDGIELEVIDLRTLIPWDRTTILESVRRTGRIATVEESVREGGWGAEVAATVVEEAFDAVDAPPLRIGAASAPIPVSPPLEEAVVPTAPRIEATLRSWLRPA